MNDRPFTKVPTMKAIPPVAAVLFAAIALGGCANQRFEGGAVPTGSDAITIAVRLCQNTARQHKGRWAAALHDGVWKVSRDLGRQSIRIDARTGKAEACRSI